MFIRAGQGRAPRGALSTLVLAKGPVEEAQGLGGAHTTHLRPRGGRFPVAEGAVGTPSLLTAIIMESMSPAT